MSTPVAPASAPNATTHGSQGAQARGQGRPHGSPAGGNDLFAQLMLQLGGETDTPSTSALLSPQSASDTADSQDPLTMPDAPPPQHPLAGLLGWHAGGSPVTTRSDTAALPELPALQDLNDALAGPRAPGANTFPAAGPSAASTGPALPAGLQRLDSPEAPDARTLAPLDPANTDPAAAGNATSRADAHTTAQSSANTPGRPAARLPAWRSTTALGQPQAGAGARPSVQVLHRPGDGPAQNPFNLARSTVQLDERFTPDNGLREPAAGALAGSVLASTAGAGVERGGVAPTADGGVSALGEASGADQGTGAQQQDAPDSGEQHPDAARADEARDAEGTGWSVQQLRQASLRVDAGDEGAIDIQLSLQGQEVQVAFRSDDAQTRTSLAQESATLDELLQRSGMALGGVSVGSQGTSSGPGGDRSSASRTPAPAGATARPREAQAPAAAPAGATRPAPRRDGSQPLDLFV